MRAWEALGDCAGDYPEFDTFESSAFLVHDTRYNRGVELLPLVLKLAKSMDHSFGADNWRAFVASDSPGVKRFAAKHLSNTLAGDAMFSEGTVGNA